MSVNSICNLALGNVEIENLADTFSACLNTNEKQRWLVSNNKTDIPIVKVLLVNYQFLSIFIYLMQFPFRLAVPILSVNRLSCVSATPIASTWPVRIATRKRNKMIIITGCALLLLPHQPAQSQSPSFPQFSPQPKAITKNGSILYLCARPTKPNSISRIIKIFSNF